MRPRLRLPIALSLILFAGRAFGDSAVRLTDLAPGVGDGLDGLDAAVLADGLYFVGRGPGGVGVGLYRYDGMNAPTLVAGSLAVEPEKLIAWQGKLYFQGGPANDRELWSYDPAGSTLVEELDIRSSCCARPQRFAIAGDQLCFGAYTDTLGFELVCWDGAAAAQVFDLEPNAGSSFPDDLTSWGAGLAFKALLATGDRLLTYDGGSFPEVVDAAAGEEFLVANCCMVVVGGQLYFEAEEGGGTARIFRYDGVTPPTHLSTTFIPAGFLGAYRGQLVSGGTDPSAGVASPELWRLVSGTLRRVRPGAEVDASTGGHLTAQGGLYFPAYPNPLSNDGDLFRYCGAGPVGVATAAFAGDDSSVVSTHPAVFQERVFVSATDPTFGEELWAITPSHLFCDDFETGGLSSWP